MCRGSSLEEENDKVINFQPTPPLRPVAELLIDKCFKSCVSDKCPICNLPSLTPDPATPMSQGDTG